MLNHHSLRLLLKLALAFCLAVGLGLCAARAQGETEDGGQDIIDVLPDHEKVVPGGSDVATPSAPGTTDWRDSVGTLTVGYLVDGDPERQRRRLEPFRFALEHASGLRVGYKAAASLNELIKLQVQRRVQYALHSASSYVTAQVLCKCVEPLAVPTDGSGAKTVHAVILAPFDGAVRALSDLKGHRLAIPQEPATITRALVLKALKNGGYDQPGDFGTLVDVANPVEGWRNVQNGAADASVGWSTLQGDLSTGYSGGTLHQLIEGTGLAKSTDIRIVWRSKPVPNPPHVIRSDLPTPLKALLKDFLFGLAAKNRAAYDSVSPYFSGGFVAIEAAEFDAMQELARVSAASEKPQ
ncbi:MAG: PhnD/SsuA/transferrin family substrate-binding protein [Rhizobiales bacterium]|nr:PhnD/SsuA/transferrin family substrate-binding protein [Hyphomicrobiales bacterium]